MGGILISVVQWVVAGGVWLSVVKWVVVVGGICFSVVKWVVVGGVWLSVAQPVVAGGIWLSAQLSTCFRAPIPYIAGLITGTQHTIPHIYECLLMALGYLSQNAGH